MERWDEGLRRRIGIPLTYALFYTLFSFLSKILILFSVLLLLRHSLMSLKPGLSGNLIILTSLSVIVAGFIVSAWLAGFRKPSLILQLFLLQVFTEFFISMVLSIIPKNVVMNLLSSFIPAYVSARLLLKYRRSQVYESLS